MVRYDALSGLKIKAELCYFTGLHPVVRYDALSGLKIKAGL